MLQWNATTHKTAQSIRQEGIHIQWERERGRGGERDLTLLALTVRLRSSPFEADLTAFAASGCFNNNNKVEHKDEYFHHIYDSKLKVFLFPYHG